MKPWTFPTFQQLMSPLNYSKALIPDYAGDLFTSAAYVMHSSFYTANWRLLS